MWLTLPLVAALLAPSQPGGGLTVTNVRSTQGPFGGPRPAGPLLPGDMLFLAFDIGGVPVSPDGKATYTMEMVVKDAAGKPVYGDKPATKTDDVPLGGTTLPGMAYTFLGLEQPAGAYTLTLTVTDEKKRAATLVHPFVIAPKGLGIVTVGTSLDEQGRLAVPNAGFVGQTLVCHFNVVGFGRDDADRRPDAPKPQAGQPAPAKRGMQPNLVAQMVVTENGKPVLEKPAAVPVEGGLPEEEKMINLRYGVFLSRPGKFVLSLSVTDRVSKKTATYNLPLTAVASPN